MTDQHFIEVIAAEVAADPSNLSLREDFISLLLESDLDRASDEISTFVRLGGDTSRAQVMRARLMAGRLRKAQELERTRATELASVSQADDDDEDGASEWEFERPAITLADVAGLAEVKKHLDVTFLAPLRNPELAAAFGQTAGGSLLMYGPPGCGKTFIAKAIAGDLGASFIHITLADLLSRWLGDSEKAIQSIFRNARAAAPCVVFFDEFDAVGGKRTSGSSQSIRTIVTQLLEELDGVQSANEGVYFLAATNRPWDIDSALRRPGRIDKTVLVLPPDSVARAAILMQALDGKPTDDVDFAKLAAATEDFSGADMSQVAKSALQHSMQESMAAGAIVPVTTETLLSAVASTTPSTRAWFDQVAPVLEYGIDDGTFEQLRAYRVQRGIA